MPYLAVIIAMVIWAGSGIAVKAALLSLSPMALILTRFSIAVLLMLAIGLAFRGNKLLGLQRIGKQDLWLFLMGGFFQPFLYFILETYSYDSFSTPTLAEAFLSTNPLMAPLFAWLFLREKITVYNILGILVSTAGMLLLVLAGSGQMSLGNAWGIPLALLTVSTAVAYSILLKKIPEKYNSLTIVFWGQLTGLCMFYLLSGMAYVITGMGVDSSFLDLFRVTVTDCVLAESVWGVSYLAVLSSVAAFIFFCYSVRYLGVTGANIFNNIRPVFTALLMLIIFGEKLPLLKWLGVLIVIVGLFLCQKQPKK